MLDRRLRLLVLVSVCAYAGSLEALPLDKYYYKVEESKGIVVGFLDKSSPSFQQEQLALDEAAGTCGCLLADGTHAVTLTSQRDATFLRIRDGMRRMAAEHGAGEETSEIAPPFAAVLADAQLISWTSATHATIKQHAGQRNWTAAALIEWVHFTFGVHVVRDADDLDAVYKATGAVYVAVAFVEQLCGEEAKTFHNALSLYSKKGGSTRMPAAISTNMALATSACGFDEGAESQRPAGGVCVYGGRASESERMPRKQSAAAKQASKMARWLQDMNTRGASAKTEL